MKRKILVALLVIFGVLLFVVANTQIATASANWNVVWTKRDSSRCECAEARFEHPSGDWREGCCLEDDCTRFIPDVGKEYQLMGSGDDEELHATGSDANLWQRFEVIERPEPDPTNTPEPTNTPTNTPTDTPTPTSTPTPTPTPTDTPTPTNTPTDTPVPPTDTPRPPTKTPKPPTETPPPGNGAVNPSLNITLKDMVEVEPTSTRKERAFPVFGLLILLGATGGILRIVSIVRRK